jgi:hypothetical protein
MRRLEVERSCTRLGRGSRPSEENKGGIRWNDVDAVECTRLRTSPDL